MPQVGPGFFQAIRYDEDHEELYDVRKDPNEWHNLALEPQYLDVKESLRTCLQSSPSVESGKIEDAHV